MTSINAIRIDNFSGLMVCDEQRGWNEEDLQIAAAYKIKPIISKEIQDRYGLVAAYGNTGTSTIGDELKHKIKLAINARYREAVEKNRKPPENFLTIEQIAKIAYDEITKLKTNHTDQILKGKFGFESSDFIRGFYMKHGKKVEISDDSLIKQVNEEMTWKDKGQEAQPVFLNAGIIAGYEPQQGFDLFHLSMIDQYWVPVQAVFLADGSGLDSANLVFSDYAAGKSIPERRGNIERVEALATIIRAVNAASKHNLGVDGYYNIIYFNGHAKNNSDRITEISDHRSKLASEIVKALTYNFIPQDVAYPLLEDLIFKGKSFWDVDEELWKHVPEPEKLYKFLRDYKHPRGIIM